MTNRVVPVIHVPDVAATVARYRDIETSQSLKRTDTMVPA
jgi:hypothetical protein